VIVTKDLTKFYGKEKGIQNLNLTIKKGEIFGLIGPNGAGKTTTLKLLSCLIRPTKGTAEIFGYNIKKDQIKIKKIMSYLPEETGLYEDMKVLDYLKFFGEMHGIKGKEVEKFVNEMAPKIWMKDKMESKIHTLSKGMKRKVGLMRTLLPDPEVILLDELTAGIDPLTKRVIIDYILEINKKGKTIIYSTHHLTEAEEICDRVAILEKGKLLTLGEVNQLKSYFHAKDLEDVFFKAVDYTKPK